MSLLDELQKLQAQDRNSDIGGLLRYLAPQAAFAGPETGTSFDDGSGEGTSRPVAPPVGANAPTFGLPLTPTGPIVPPLVASDPTLTPQPSPLDMLPNAVGDDASLPNRAPFFGATMPAASAPSPPINGSQDAADDSVAAKPADDGTRHLVNYEEEKDKSSDQAGPGSSSGSSAGGASSRGDAQISQADYPCSLIYFAKIAGANRCLYTCPPTDRIRSVTIGSLPKTFCPMWILNR